MARDSFLMYTEWGNQVSRLSDNQAGVLLKAIFAYNNGDRMPDMDDKTDMCFSFIQGQLDRDSKKYNDVCEKRRESGKKGGIANATKRKQMLPNATFGKQTVANQADNDNEYENDNDNDNEYDDALRKKKERTHRIMDDDNPDDDYDLRHEGEGEVYFKPTVKLGMKTVPVKQGVLTEADKERIRQHTAEVVKRLHG